MILGDDWLYKIDVSFDSVVKASHTPVEDEKRWWRIVVVRSGRTAPSEKYCLAAAASDYFYCRGCCWQIVGVLSCDLRDTDWGTGGTGEPGTDSFQFIVLFTIVFLKRCKWDREVRCSFSDMPGISLHFFFAQGLLTHLSESFSLQRFMIS